MDVQILHTVWYKLNWDRQLGPPIGTANLPVPLSTDNWVTGSIASANIMHAPVVAVMITEHWACVY